jgi:hypothetical protein
MEMRPSTEDPATPTPTRRLREGAETCARPRRTDFSDRGGRARLRPRPRRFLPFRAALSPSPPLLGHSAGDLGRNEEKPVEASVWPPERKNRWKQKKTERKNRTRSGQLWVSEKHDFAG